MILLTAPGEGDMVMGIMSAVFWLLLLIENASPLHVGNFPDIASCLKAGLEHQVVDKPGAGDPTTFVCVQANTGKGDEPGPPN
jgi:hypothetical protein